MRLRNFERSLTLLLESFKLGLLLLPKSVSYILDTISASFGIEEKLIK
jgi:hypothetical protein